MKKRVLAILLALAMVAVLLPVAALADTTQVWAGGQYLTEGENNIGGGTATLNSEEKTLTLNNVSLNNFISITYFNNGYRTFLYFWTYTNFLHV